MTTPTTTPASDEAKRLIAYLDEYIDAARRHSGMGKTIEASERIKAHILNLEQIIGEANRERDAALKTQSKTHTDYVILSDEHQDLRERHSALQAENERLRESCLAETTRLEKSYSRMVAEHDELKAANAALANRYNELANAYDELRGRKAWTEAK